MTDAPTKDVLLAEIRRRMSQGEPFTFADLYSGLDELAYRAADAEIQRWRRKGLITFTRIGRQTVWNLTDAGRESIKEAK